VTHNTKAIPADWRFDTRRRDSAKKRIQNENAKGRTKVKLLKYTVH
jgi:hypothetical protein